MKKKKDSLDTIKDAFLFLKKNPKKEFSIYKIAKSIKSRWESTARVLKYLKEMGLVKERKGNKKPMPQRLFSFKK